MVCNGLGAEFLQKEGEEFLKTHALNEFDFDPTPKEEWAKQIVYDMKPFNNVIKSGDQIIAPSTYFALKSPSEAELHKKLDSLTVENTLLNDHSGKSTTKFGGSRRASQPFIHPAVSISEKGQASSQLRKYGVIPVEQGIVNKEAYERTQRISTLLDETIPPEVSIPLVDNTGVALSFDADNLEKNIPSLNHLQSTTQPDLYVSSSDPMMKDSFYLQPSLMDPILPSPSPVTQSVIPHQSLNIFPLSTHPNDNPSKSNPLYSGSDRDLLETLLFGEKKGILDTPRSSVSVQQQPISIQPPATSVFPQSPQSNGSQLYSVQPNERHLVVTHEGQNWNCFFIPRKVPTIVQITSLCFWLC